MRQKAEGKTRSGQTVTDESMGSSKVTDTSQLDCQPEPAQVSLYPCRVLGAFLWSSGNTKKKHALSARIHARQAATGDCRMATMCPEGMRNCSGCPNLTAREQPVSPLNRSTCDVVKAEKDAGTVHHRVR